MTAGPGWGLFEPRPARYIDVMNAHDRDLSGKPAELAVLHYGDGDFVVLKPGRFVACAVTGVRIPLEALRYWSPALQEAYAGPTEAYARWKEHNS